MCTSVNKIERKGQIDWIKERNPYCNQSACALSAVNTAADGGWWVMIVQCYTNINCASHREMNIWWLWFLLSKCATVYMPSQWNYKQNAKNFKDDLLQLLYVTS